MALVLDSRTVPRYIKKIEEIRQFWKQRHKQYKNKMDKERCMTSLAECEYAINRLARLLDTLLEKPHGTPEYKNKHR